MGIQKKSLKKFWAKVTVSILLLQVFSPGVTVLADSLDNEMTVVSNNVITNSETNSGNPLKENTLNEMDKKESVESKSDKNKNNDEATGESQNSNDSPSLEKIEEELSGENFLLKQGSKLITFGSDGIPLLNGEAFYKNEEQIQNEDLQELVKQGGDIGSDGDIVRSSMTRAGTTIEYLGQVSHGSSVVGHFRVDKEDAFCIEHSKPTPPSGTPAEDGLIYEDPNIRSVLYYGWNGPENIFTNFAEGYTVTSLVLSYYYTGVASGINTVGAQALINKVKANKAPDASANFSTSNPKVNLVNGEQRTENITLNADSRNVFKLSVPQGLTYHLVGGGTVTNGTAEIKGKDTFYLTADMKYTNKFSSEAMAGSMKKYQTVLTKPKDENLQSLGRGGWYDPGFTLQFTANFFARVGDVHLIKEDSETGATPQGDASLNGAVYRIKDSAGTTKDVTIAGNKATANDLQMGKVTIQEITPPTGYLLDPTVYTVDLDYNAATGKIEVTRTLKEEVVKGHVSIMKYFAINEGSSILKPEAGAGFGIYLKSTGELKQYQMTGESGLIMFKDLPYGRYIIKQTEAPEGSFKVDDFEVDVTEHGKTYTYAILNDKFMSPVRLAKVDEDTGKNVLVPGTIFKIKNVETGLWVSQTTHNLTEFETDKTGEVLLYDKLRHGKYELHEIKAPDGYIINKNPLPFTVNEANQNDGVITIKFANKAQKGQVELHKTGDVATDSKTSDTDYGKLYEFVYSQKGLPGAEFDVKAAEDIVTGDGTVRVKKGEIAGQGVTDEKGNVTIGDLYLGKYTLVETKAPNGMVLDGKETPFELTYAGQNVDLTTTSVTVENKLQDLRIKIHKTEEKVIKWENGQPLTEQVPSDGKVFGVFTDQQFSYNAKVILPQDVLIGLATTKEGVAEVQKQYPQGKFYVKEVDAGNEHSLNPAKYAFEFTAEDNNETLEIGIWGDSVAYGNQNHLKIARTSITNELAKQEVELVKVDTETNLGSETPLANVPFKLIQVLSDGKEVVLGEYHTTIDGKINVEGLPVGTYKFREVNPLEGYLPLGEDIPFHVEIETNGTKIMLKAINRRIPPTLRTIASGVNGEKEFDTTIDNTIYDDVAYSNVITGQEMLVVTELYEKGVNGAFGKKVWTQKENVTFTTSSGSHRVVIKIPKNTLDPEKDYVFVEKIYRDPAGSILYVEHNDPTDKGQTIHANPLVVPVKVVKMPQTGEQRGEGLLVMGVAFITLGSALYFWKKRSEKKK